MRTGPPCTRATWATTAETRPTSAPAEQAAAIICADLRGTDTGKLRNTPGSQLDHNTPRNKTECQGLLTV